MTLYLDMDGVLMDFNRALRAHGVVDDMPRYHHRPQSEWTAEQLAHDKRIREVMDLPDFWSSIRPMDDAKLLWDFCSPFDPHILTALPNVTAHANRIRQQKRDSIWDWIDPLFPLNSFHTCLRAEKKALARPGAVLVDDMPSNCEEWIAAGGTAILHKDAVTTIKILRELGYVSPEFGLCPGCNVIHHRDAPCYEPPGFSAPKPRDKTSAERKAEPIHSGVMLYFPDALAAVSRISKAGNDKHNPGEPLHWARGKSMDQMDASARHMLTLETVDPETGEVEAAANAWRALAQLQLIEERRLAKAGIKSYSGVAP